MRYPVDAAQREASGLGNVQSSSATRSARTMRCFSPASATSAAPSPVTSMSTPDGVTGDLDVVIQAKREPQRVKPRPEVRTRRRHAHAHRLLSQSHQT